MGRMSRGSRISVWTVVGTILIVASIGFIIFAHAFPHWQDSKFSRQTGVPSIGLWEICFDDKFTAPAAANDVYGKEYSEGCHYVFDRDLRSIRHWMFPSWFIVVITFATTGLLFQPICLIMNIIYYVRVCSAHYEHLLLLVSALINLITGLFTSFAIFIFGLKAAKDQDWMPQPESNYLSYSYGVCACVPILCFVAAMCHFVDFLRLKTARDLHARAKVYARGEFARY